MRAGELPPTMPIPPPRCTGRPQARSGEPPINCTLTAIATTGDYVHCTSTPKCTNTTSEPSPANHESTKPKDRTSPAVVADTYIPGRTNSLKAGRGRAHQRGGGLVVGGLVLCRKLRKSYVWGPTSTMLVRRYPNYTVEPAAVL